MENKKLTEREIWTILGERYSNDDLLQDLMTRRITALDKKISAKGTSKTQVENVEIKDMLYKTLQNIARPVTITELLQIDSIANYVVASTNMPLSNQKVSALFSQMIKEGKIVKTVDKKKSYFTIA